MLNLLVFHAGYSDPNFKPHLMETKDLADTFQFIVQICFCLVVDDIAFYFTHRLMHTPFFYTRFHKVHHSFTSTISLATSYTHPFEYLFGNMLPIILGPLILGPNMHILTAMCWYGLRTAESLDGHCGYEFSWSPYRFVPFSGGSAYHDFHHSSNVGNYSSWFSIMDTVFGTNKDFYDQIKKNI